MRKKPDFEVEMDGYYSDVRDLFLPVLNKFAEKIRQNIIVSNPHRQSLPPYRGNKFGLCIHFWTFPPGKGSAFERGQVEYAYGFKTLDGQEWSFVLSGCEEFAGSRIIDHEGNTLALIEGKTLYVLFNLPYANGRPNIADKILDLILDDYYLYMSDRSKFDAEMKTRVENINEVRFVRQCKRYFDALAGGHEEAEERLGRLKAEFLTAFRRKEELRREKLSGQTVKFAPDSPEKLYETLCSLSATGEIRVIQQSICIPAGQVDIRYEGATYDIGKFEIWIDLFSGNRKGVRCFNLTRMVGECQHPHITAEGDPCLGNIHHVIRSLLKEGDLVSVFLVMRDYLRTYNEDGPYRKIENWPERTTKSARNRN